MTEIILGGRGGGAFKEDLADGYAQQEQPQSGRQQYRHHPAL